MINGDAPAFPVDFGIMQGEGMTLRDYFASDAMKGWLASCGDKLQHPVEKDGVKYVAKMSYAMADAMLLARGK